MSSQVKRKAPGPGVAAIPRILRDFPRNPIKFSVDLLQKYGDIVRFWIGPYLVHLIAKLVQILPRRKRWCFYLWPCKNTG
jgi:hypothetical protein